MANWLALAAKPGGDDWATDQLLTQPDLTDEALPYWEAFNELSEERALRSISLGMNGSIEAPRTIRRSEIRRDGKALGYRGEDLEDFFAIIRRVDRLYVEEEGKRIAADLKRMQAKAKKKR